MSHGDTVIIREVSGRGNFKLDPISSDGIVLIKLSKEYIEALNGASISSAIRRERRHICSMLTRLSLSTSEEPQNALT